MKNGILFLLFAVSAIVPQFGRAQSGPVNFETREVVGYSQIHGCHVPRFDMVDGNGLVSPITLFPQGPNLELSYTLSTYGGNEFGAGAFIAPNGADIISGSQSTNYTVGGDWQYWDIAYSICCDGQVYNILISIGYNKISLQGYTVVHVLRTGASCE